MGMRGPDPSFIEEHQVLLPTEPSPQPNIGVSFKIASICKFVHVCALQSCDIFNGKKSKPFFKK